MNAHFLLAPMAELSHRPLRELIENFGGCDEYFTEMISAGPLLGGGPFEHWYMDAGPCSAKVVYQLVGSDPDQLVRAAALLDSRDCLGLDINMGCAAPAIRRTGAGVAWMASIDKAGALIARLRPAVKKRLSVKLRIGFTDDFDYLLNFCRRLEGEGIELITLHPRTAGEKFRRSPRWNYVSALRRELHIPVAGNGDIVTAADLLLRADSVPGAILAGTAGTGGPAEQGDKPIMVPGAAPVMVGRAAVRCPWIFAEARRKTAPGAIDLEEISLRFLELLARYQPPEFYISRARRFFNYFCDNLKWAHYVKTLLNRETELGGIERVLRGYFGEHPEERFKKIDGFTDKMYT
ncbi:tRNA-dihydrouridine synthase [Spirochaetia bacterium]|nr:tRNA-dihydrouridine synthase [Spirochaetia bacterium]